MASSHPLVSTEITKIICFALQEHSLQQSKVDPFDTPLYTTDFDKNSHVVAPNLFYYEILLRSYRSPSNKNFYFQDLDLKIYAAVVVDKYDLARYMK